MFSRARSDLIFSTLCHGIWKLAMMTMMIARCLLLSVSIRLKIINNTARDTTRAADIVTVTVTDLL